MARKRLTKVPRKHADRLVSVIKVPAPVMPGHHSHIGQSHSSVRAKGSPIWRYAAQDFPVEWVELPLEFEPNYHDDDTVVNLRHEPNVYAMLSLRQRWESRFLERPMKDHKVRSGRGLHLAHGAFALDIRDPAAADFVRVAFANGDVHDIARTLAAYGGLNARK